jgi:tRNA(Ile)-lysidine synthase
VSFERQALLGQLAELAGLAGTPGRYVVAFSGGLDSTVLLHALAASRDADAIPLLAVHIDHGLHNDSTSWSRRCESFANSLGIDFIDIAVHIPADSGQGAEAAAREARYNALRSVVRRGDWMLSAHHKDDQAETLLLNLMRGSGPAGLAGIAAVRPFAEAWLVRPLLSISRNDLQDYARVHDLNWIDDPSNEDRQFDRNFLRHEVLPLLENRWPGVADRIRRSATLAGEASQLLDLLADADYRRLGERPDRLGLGSLRALSPERQRNVLRYVVRELGLPSPPAAQLQSVITDLIPARDDAQPVVQWPGVEVRRYRDNVYIMSAGSVAEGHAAVLNSCVSITKAIALPSGLGELSFEPDAPHGLTDAVVSAGLQLRFRSGGEEIKLVGQSHTRKLKKLLQEEGVVPWMRERLPLLYSGGHLVAVADLWIAASAASEPGTAIRWKNRPAIH